MTLTLPSPDRCSINGKVRPPERHVELLVIGAGKAGCAAAIEAAKAGADVLLVDEHPVAPGLIGLDVPYHFGGRATAAVQNPERLVEVIAANNPALMEAMELGVDVALSTIAWGAWVDAPGFGALSVPMVGLADETRSWFVGFDRLILATGARDLNLSFQGSEQPGVMGAQGFAALVTRYEAFSGSRVAIVGTDALAAATARLALERGVEVAALVEVRDAPVASSEVSELASRGIEVVTGHVPLEAKGTAEGVTALVLAKAGVPHEKREIACDTVCLAVGTVPTIELFDVLSAARTLAPERGGHVPVLSAEAPGATSLGVVFAAGDCAGLGEDATASGRAAARSALASLGREPDASLDDAATPARAEGSDLLAYPMDWTRALLATGGPDVLACVCEEVTRQELLTVSPPRYLDWRSNAKGRRDLGTLAQTGRLDQDQMKRLTRVCMGACQARRCREQVAMIMALGGNVAPETIPLAGYRAPVRPLPLSVLADAQETADAASDWNVWFGISTQWITYDDIGTEREEQQLREGLLY